MKIKTSKLQFRVLFFLSACSFFLPQKVIAGPIGVVRPITSNNIYQCSTGIAYEQVTGNSNINQTWLSYAVGCLNRDGTARWIIQAAAACSSGSSCSDSFSGAYLSPDFDRQSGTYTRSFPQVVIGTDCELEEVSNLELWSCEQMIHDEDGLTVSTVGDSEMMLLGQFFQQYGNLPTIGRGFRSSNRTTR